MDCFLVNSPFTVYQNTCIYADSQSAIYNGYDYIFNVNITNVWNSMNVLFNERNYKQRTNDQNNSNENMYDVYMSTNADALLALFTQNTVYTFSNNSDVSTKPAYNTLDPAYKTLGFRFLEVVATKIFGHAKARAAIANDSDFYQTGVNSIISQILNGIENAVQNKKNTIFSTYVSYDRIEETMMHNIDVNDADGNTQFNFYKTIWEFPLIFNSSIIPKYNSDPPNMDAINNGPDVGGNKLAGGQMSVPILISISDDVGIGRAQYVPPTMP